MIERLRALAVVRFGPRAGELAADADLYEFLEIDSLQALDLLTDLEAEFGIEVPDYELQGVTTLAGLAEVIEARI